MKTTIYNATVFVRGFIHNALKNEKEYIDLIDEAIDANTMGHSGLLIAVHKDISALGASQRIHTCTENVLKTRFEDVQNVNSEDVHDTSN